MKKLVSAAAVALAAALSFSATSDAGSLAMRFGDQAQSNQLWSPAVVRGCIVKRLIAKDYHGNVYIRKVRVCG